MIFLSNENKVFYLSYATYIITPKQENQTSHQILGKDYDIYY